MQHGLSVQAADSAGVCPVHAAADRGHTQVVALLVDKGADLHGQTNEGITPLHLAARGGHSGTAKLLISLGADANAATSNGLTPLHIAVQEGFTQGGSLGLKASSKSLCTVLVLGVEGSVFAPLPLSIALPLYIALHLHAT